MDLRLVTLFSRWIVTERFNACLNSPLHILAHLKLGHSDQTGVTGGLKAEASTLGHCLPYPCLALTNGFQQPWNKVPSCQVLGTPKRLPSNKPPLVHITYSDIIFLSHPSVRLRDLCEASCPKEHNTEGLNSLPKRHIVLSARAAAAQKP